MNTLSGFAILPANVAERLGLTLAIIAAGLVLYWLTNRIILLRAQRKGALQRSDLPFELGISPAILYFTTPDCVPCKTVQRPALKRLQDHLGSHLQVVEVNAQERPDLASRWGVLSVPTTFIIDAKGKLRHVNHGVTRAEKLMQQLQEL